MARKPCPRCSIRSKAQNDGYCKPCRAEYSRRYNGKPRVFTCGSCVICSEPFVSSNSNSTIGKYCSFVCEKKATRRAYNKRYRQKNRWKGKYRGETRDWIPIILADPCVYCGAPCTDVEHIVPRASRGDDTWENLVGACGACNRRKSAKSLLTFLLDAVSTA